MESTKDRIVGGFIVFAVLVPFASQAQEITLKYQPQVGDKQTVRITAEDIIGQDAGQQQQEMEHSKAVTLDTEVLKVAPDGAVALKITYRAMQEKTGVKGGKAIGEYDSTNPDQESNPMYPFYSPMMDQSFTVTVSSQGRLMDLDLSHLYESMAEVVLNREDNDIRKRQGDKAQQTIDRLNQRYGSRDKRRQSVQEQLAQSPFTNGKMIKGMMSYLFVPLPADPVQIGASWQGPLNMYVGMGLEVQGTYTLMAVDNHSVTVEVRGERDKSDDPIIEEQGDVKRTVRFGGAYTARIRVDLETGQLLRQESTVQLTGETSIANGQQGTGPRSMNMSIQSKVQVEPIRSD